MKAILLFLGIVFIFTGFVSNNLISLSVNIPQSSKYIQPGEQVFIELSIVSKAIEKGDITITYIIRDEERNIIDKETETALLITRISHVRSLEIPETAKKGSYSFLVEVAKEGENIATASDTFYVGKKPFLTTQNMLIIITALIIISLLVIIYELRKIKEQMKSHIKIDENVLAKRGLIKIKRR